MAGTENTCESHYLKWKGFLASNPKLFLSIHRICFMICQFSSEGIFFRIYHVTHSQTAKLYDSSFMTRLFKTK